MPVGQAKKFLTRLRDDMQFRSSIEALHGKPEELQKEIKAAGCEFTGPELERAIPEVSDLDWAADVDVATLHGFDDVTPEW